MVGRTLETNAFDLLISRSAQGRTERGIILHGLHGVGKTALLNDYRRRAEEAGFMVVWLEARDADGGPLAVRKKLARSLLQAGRKLLHRAPGEQLYRALAGVASYAERIGVTGIDIGVGAGYGRADSGSLEVDLEEMVEDLASAMAGRGSALVFFMDEMQELDAGFLSALLSVQHQAAQRDWPFYVVGAGLPNVPSILGSARPYAETLFNYRALGALSRAEAEEALVLPAAEHGVSFVPGALDVLLNASGGYPYFLQEYGSAAWESAPEKRITVEDARVAETIGRAQLDQGFFPSRWRRASRAEKDFLRLMAIDGAAGSATPTLAARAGKKMTSMTMTRASLISKGIIYAPSLGRLEFTVPGMSDYIRRISG